ncbi:Fur family transcriptional regulator [Peptostreptococcus canis]|uniref:Transcriptional repressor n=1 Tax=Peptostreptococcus canis TaxID=1159213 RepID=A0ABR6TN49_9FIRM|nr:Fur family transcriptional regulator [Peptostreptococcus canis]MBC2576842.1 transcriptional repressor [Peptostreptococcus canis]MBP1998937.1 Fur family ferric uptake transcriptional regulator [Peptostreptococcus canis]
MTLNKCDCSLDNHRKENNNILKSANLKATKKRMILLNCLRHSDAPLNAEEIYNILKQDININLSTVYRALSALTDADILVKQILSDGNNVYQINNKNHRHIITCKICNKISYVNICPINDVIDSVSKDTGYEITGHNLEFIGICPNCIEKIEEN